MLALNICSTMGRVHAMNSALIARAKIMSSQINNDDGTSQQHGFNDEVGDLRNDGVRNDESAPAECDSPDLGSADVTGESVGDR